MSRVVCVLLLLSLSRSVQAKETATAQQVASWVQAFYENCRSLRANFVQKHHARVQGTKKVQRGRLALKKRGKLSFRYASGDRVVSNGKRVVVYRKKQKTAYRGKADASLYATGFSFLMGKGRLQKAFRFRLLASKKPGYVLLATPRKPSPLLTMMVLYVDKKTHQVRRLMLVDAQGNTNRFVLSNIRINRKIGNKEFVFRPPRGTKIVRL